MQDPVGADWGRHSEAIVAEAVLVMARRRVLEGLVGLVVAIVQVEAVGQEAWHLVDHYSEAVLQQVVREDIVAVRQEVVLGIAAGRDRLGCSVFAAGGVAVDEGMVVAGRTAVAVGKMDIGRRVLVGAEGWVSELPVLLLLHLLLLPPLLVEHSTVAIADAIELVVARGSDVAAAAAEHGCLRSHSLNSRRAVVVWPADCWREYTACSVFQKQADE